MKTIFNSLLIVLATLVWTSTAVIHYTSKDMSPANFIYQANLSEVNAQKYTFTDSMNIPYTNAVWSQYAYPTPSIGTNVFILDPDNPANIILFVRNKPANTLSIPGGYLIHMIEPFENTIRLLNYKIGIKDTDDPMPLGMGTIGIPRMEDMYLDENLSHGPVLGMIGFKDRVADQHVINLSYHMVTQSGIVPELEPEDDNVARVVSCKMINLLVKHIDVLLPGDSKNDHFLTGITIPADAEIGDDALPLHLDQAKMIYKFFMMLVNRNILTQEGELASGYEELKYYYQMMEEDDQEEEFEETSPNSSNIKTIELL